MTNRARPSGGGPFLFPTEVTMPNEHDLERYELLAEGDGIDMLAIPFDDLAMWLRMTCGAQAADYADTAARALKIRARAAWPRPAEGETPLPDYTPEEWDTLLERAQCPGPHSGQTAIVHSPDFFTEGRTFGIGTSATVCSACIEDVTAVIQARYGSAVLRRPGRQAGRS